MQIGIRRIGEDFHPKILYTSKIYLEFRSMLLRVEEWTWKSEICSLLIFGKP